jgi:hypothetical protein
MLWPAWTTTSARRRPTRARPRAQVYKAVLDGTQPVAVKKLLRSDGALDAKFLREIAILKECHSTQVVQFLGACLTPGCTMLVTELLAGGSLHDMLRVGRFAWYKGCAGPGRRHALRVLLDVLLVRLCS